MCAGGQHPFPLHCQPVVAADVHLGRGKEGGNRTTDGRPASTSQRRVRDASGYVCVVGASPVFSPSQEMKAYNLIIFLWLDGSGETARELESREGKKNRFVSPPLNFATTDSVKNNNNNAHACNCKLDYVYGVACGNVSGQIGTTLRFVVTLRFRLARGAVEGKGESEGSV